MRRYVHCSACRSVSSTGTDTYSAIAAAVGSLKGPKHGGANITCCHMMKEVIAQCGYDASDRKIKNAIHKLKNREMFDQSGLIYGFGHAVYTGLGSFAAVIAINYFSNHNIGLPLVVVPLVR